MRLGLLPGLLDTQAGLKGFRADVAERLFRGWLPAGFSFDLALLFRTRRLGLRIEQVPIFYQYLSEPSTVRLLRDTTRMLADVVQIRIRLIGDRFEHRGSALRARARIALDALRSRAAAPVQEGFGARGKIGVPVSAADLEIKHVADDEAEHQAAAEEAGQELCRVIDRGLAEGVSQEELAGALSKRQHVMSRIAQAD